MKYQLTTMDELDLLKALRYIDGLMNNHYVDLPALEKREQQLKKMCVLQSIAEVGLSREEALRLLSINKKP